MPRGYCFIQAPARQVEKGRAALLGHACARGLGGAGAFRAPVQPHKCERLFLSLVALDFASVMQFASIDSGILGCASKTQRMRLSMQWLGWF